MVVTLPSTQQLIQEYLDTLVRHGDFGSYFSDDVVAILEGVEPQVYRGRQSVTDWINGAHALGTVKVVGSFACETHATAECEFVRKDGVSVPYTVTYDVSNGKITALRLFFTAPIA